MPSGSRTPARGATASGSRTRTSAGRPGTHPETGVVAALARELTNASAAPAGESTSSKPRTIPPSSVQRIRSGLSRPRISILPGRRSANQTWPRRGSLRSDFRSIGSPRGESEGLPIPARGSRSCRTGVLPGTAWLTRQGTDGEAGRQCQVHPGTYLVDVLQRIDRHPPPCQDDARQVALSNLRQYWRWGVDGDRRWGEESANGNPGTSPEPVQSSLRTVFSACRSRRPR